LKRQIDLAIKPLATIVKVISIKLSSIVQVFKASLGCESKDKDNASYKFVSERKMRRRWDIISWVREVQVYL
jgi:hypothetical protein